VTKLAKTVERLCRVSREQALDPRSVLEWPEAVDPDAWYTSPELISLHGTEAYDALDEPARKRLSFFEAVAFYSINIHGERFLMEGLAKRLYRKEHEAISPYLHHFLEEENKHMTYFGTFCLRYAGRIYPERKVAFPSEHAPGEEDFLFFAQVLVFEEIVDVYNRRMARDERLHPLAREINRLHHFEETRHLSFGRDLVQSLLDDASWDDAARARIAGRIGAFLAATWREYYSADAYRDAGIPEPFEVRRRAMAHPAARERRREVSEGLVKVLLDLGLPVAEPELS